ncbi:MAG: hypothetical protein FWC50_02115 [Planctomycetaceae bacterium]|nr:hypothetical protein [Planctomycetaceae bacterium]
MSGESPVSLGTCRSVAVCSLRSIRLNDKVSDGATGSRYRVVPFFSPPQYSQSRRDVYLFLGQTCTGSGYSSRLKVPEAGGGKPCNAGRLREAEGCHPYRLRYILRCLF